MVVIRGDRNMSLVERRRAYEPTGLPVAADVWVYTQPEWESLAIQNPHLWRRLQGEIIELPEAKPDR